MIECARPNGTYFQESTKHHFFVRKLFWMLLDLTERQRNISLVPTYNYINSLTTKPNLKCKSSKRLIASHQTSFISQCPIE